MVGNADDAIRITRRDGEVLWTILISLGEQTNPHGFIPSTVLRIAEAATNTFPAVLMNLPSGSRINWEMKIIGNSSEEPEKSKKGRKRNSKKSPRTSGRKRNTSKGVKKKVKNS